MSWRLPPRLRRWRLVWPDEAGMGAVPLIAAKAAVECSPHETATPCGHRDLVHGVPHPSYPPLETAHLGLLTLTNGFGGKDLATWHTNISTLDEISADEIASRLSER